ncbi:hypothetical protein COLO4_35317 [Corchorus olitorius]|uniref:Uncharacterized protein n=1 Tax=Corchorus olitorius TaxID=93759 RepID=A0A1R3GHJ9_9ROSI|nr:hypothetical protein COLO4_35317 [Corchorus olitorius]
MKGEHCVCIDNAMVVFEVFRNHGHNNKIFFKAGCGRYGRLRSDGNWNNKNGRTNINLPCFPISGGIPPTPTREKII